MENICALDIVYKLSPIDHFNKKLIANIRIELGENLSLNIPKDVKEKIEYITPCPNSGNYYAMGLAKKINKYYLQSIVKKNSDKRLFTIDDINKRKLMLQNNLIPIPELIKGKKIAVVDEAIFSGMTLKFLVEKMKMEGAAEIYLCIPSPPCVVTCPFGKHKGRTALLNKISYSMLQAYFDCDGIFFQNIESFKSIIGINKKNNFCITCFTG